MCLNKELLLQLAAKRKQFKEFTLDAAMGSYLVYRYTRTDAKHAIITISTQTGKAAKQRLVKKGTTQ